MSNIGNKETFAKNLSFYMDVHQKSQKDMAEIVGVAPSTFNDWMKAKKYPRIDKIEKLANYFAIAKSDLIEEPPEEQPESERSMLMDADTFDIVCKYKGLSPGQKKMVRQFIDAVMFG